MAESSMLGNGTGPSCSEVQDLVNEWGGAVPEGLSGIDTGF